MKGNDDEHSHPVFPAEVIAEDIKLEMCSLVELTPENPVAEARITVITRIYGQRLLRRMSGRGGIGAGGSRRTRR